MRPTEREREGEESEQRPMIVQNVYYYFNDMKNKKNLINKYAIYYYYDGE